MCATWISAQKSFGAQIRRKDALSPLELPVSTVIDTGPYDSSVPGIRIKKRTKGWSIAVLVHALNDPSTLLPSR